MSTETLPEVRNDGAFISAENLPFWLKAVKLSVVPDDNDDPRKMADVTFQVAPLSFELAADIDLDLAGHIFTRKGDRWEPRDEVFDFTFDLRVEPQGMTYRRDPDFPDNGGYIEDVRIEKLRVNKDPKLGVLFLAFIARFAIVSNDVTSRLVIDLLKEKAYLTFAPMQARLEM